MFGALEILLEDGLGACAAVVEEAVVWVLNGDYWVKRVRGGADM